MQVKLESIDDVKCVNWPAVAERIADHARRKIVETMDRAAREIKELAPGEVRTFTIEIGSIEISRDLENKTSQLAAECA